MFIAGPCHLTPSGSTIHRFIPIVAAAAALTCKLTLMKWICSFCCGGLTIGKIFNLFIQTYWVGELGNVICYTFIVIFYLLGPIAGVSAK